MFGSFKDRQGLEISCDLRAQSNSEWLSEGGNGLCSLLLPQSSLLLLFPQFVHKCHTEELPSSSLLPEVARAERLPCQSWFGKNWSAGCQDWHLFSAMFPWLCLERAGGHEATKP